MFKYTLDYINLIHLSKVTVNEKKLKITYYFDGKIEAQTFASQSDFDDAVAAGGHQRQGNHFLHGTEAVFGFRPAFHQGKEGDAGILFIFETAFGRHQEIILVRCLEGLETVHGAELEGGGGPDIQHFLSQAAVQQIISGKNNLNDLVIEIVQGMFAGAHSPLPPCGRTDRQGAEYGKESLH